MYDYPYRKLGGLCSILSSKRIFAKEYVEHGVPFYRSKEIIQKHNGENINTELFISEERFCEIEKRYGAPRAGDMLMTSVGTLGVAYIVTDSERFYFKDGNLTWYRDFSSELNSKYLYYLFNSTIGKDLIKSIMIGSSQAALTIDGMKSLEVPCPDILIQGKIVQVLSTYDSLIENNNRRIAILEEMAQKLYREWFVNFRFPGHENVKMVESEIGLIPEGWMVQSPKEVAAHYIGGGWGKESCSDALQPAFVIRGTDIPNARQNDIENCPLRYHTKSNLKDRCLSNGDIVIEVSGGSKGQPVGRPLLITSELLESFNGQHVICASFCKLYRCNSTLINPYYVYLWLLEIYKNGEIEKYQSQSTGIINFKFEYFLDSPIILVPQIDVQNAFNKQVEMIFKQINNLGKKNTNLRKTRDLLLPSLIAGEIDVSRLDIPTREG